MGASAFRLRPPPRRVLSSSGAFVFSRCLIYKVHTCSQATGIALYQMAYNFVKRFFKFFEKLLTASRQPRELIKDNTPRRYLSSIFSTVSPQNCQPLWCKKPQAYSNPPVLQRNRGVTSAPGVQSFGYLAFPDWCACTIGVWFPSAVISAAHVSCLIKMSVAGMVRLLGIPCPLILAREKVVLQ